MLKTAHPSKEQLSAFNLGELDPTTSAEIELHVEQCNRCSETLLGLTGDDTFIDLLRHARAASAYDETNAPAGSGPTASLEPEIPQQLATHPRYRVLELLGRGGMGDVYKAEHKMMNRTVALKVINKRLVANRSAVERFHREVQAAARLAHPNIVTAYDAEQAGDMHFLAMEFVDGVDLSEIVGQRGPLPVNQACHYIRQAALGLQHAHEQGMVHRDIKPQNLMVEGAGLRLEGQVSQKLKVADRDKQPERSTLKDRSAVKILDFGLASFVNETAADEIAEAGQAVSEAAVLSQLTAWGTMMGTPDYISPEQSEDARSADIRADIYSLGCTFYFLLTGKPPFEEGDVVEKLAAHKQQEPQPMESVRTDIPAELADTIRRMMSKDPAERFQTPTEVADALAPLVDRHRTGSAAPKGSKQGEVESHGYHPSRSHKRPLAHRLVVTVLLLFLLAALAASLIYVTTDKGTLQIRTNTYDVEVVVKQQGELVEIVDSRNGANLIRLRSGVYEVELKDDKDQFTLSKDQFTLRRGQRVIVDVKHVAEQPWHSTNKTPPQRHRYAFAPPDKTIAQDGIVVEEQGWRIDAPAPRTVRLFEVPMKDTHNGMLTYRARLKTKDIEGRAYLAMWVRFPGMGEFFSKGLHNAVRGTNDWSEYEIPFMLKKGQEPDLVKLNLEVEGTGTVWIKDVELRSVTSADVKEAPAVSDDPSPVIRDVGIERLLERSKAGSNAEREEVIDQLQDLGRNQFPVDATLALIRIARECADEEIAREATDAIAEIGEDNRAAAKIALPAMIALMNERNAPADVREGAVRALGEIGSKQPQLKEVKSCVPPLLELLDSDTPQFVEMALWSLREIGLADRSLVEPALPSIARMASESKNSKMRNAAADVIQRLNDSP